MVTGSRPAPVRNKEEIIAEVQRLRDLHDSWAADAFDRKNDTAWQYHAGKVNAYEYVLYIFRGFNQS